MTDVGQHQFAALGDLLGERLGLRFTPDRYDDLERAIGRAASDAGYDRSRIFIDHLLAGGMDERCVQALAWHLTVGETYFFRGNSAFAVLERSVLPAIIEARRQGSRHLRIWSAGCSSGEEPYSLAILLTRMLPDIADWRLTILATDINTRALAKAEGGIYSEWSFRDVSSTMRSQYFTKAGSKGWAIVDRVKRLVTFSYLNLATGAFPALATNTTAMDVILCRNVLMYFKTPVIKKVTARLHGALVAGGSLLVAPSEASAEHFPQFTRVTKHGEIYFRRDAARPATPARSTAAARPAASAEQRPAHPAPAAKAPAAKPDKAAKPENAAADAAALAEEARLAANEGRLEQACGLCERAIGVAKTAADLRYLHATILDELARPHEAIQALTSALYLDPELVVAHFLLGNVARRQGRHRLAGRHLRRTLELLEGFAPGDPVPAADGLSANDLARIAESLLGLEVTA